MLFDPVSLTIFYDLPLKMILLLVLKMLNSGIIEFVFKTHNFQLKTRFWYKNHLFKLPGVFRKLKSWIVQYLITY
jgi:hypothetical protein